MSPLIIVSISTYKETNAMSIDTRINDILNEYENEWDDSFIDVIQESFPQ